MTSKSAPSSRFRTRSMLRLKASAVREAHDIEVCTELAIQDTQHVAIESGRYTSGVIVCGLHRPALLAQVRAEQQPIEWSHDLSHACQESACRRRVEIADRAAEKRKEHWARQSVGDT